MKSVQGAQAIGALGAKGEHRPVWLEVPGGRTVSFFAVAGGAV